MTALALAEAQLSAAERRTLDRFVVALRDRLGDGLVSVWLYGSRARGERAGAESDVDLLAIVEPGTEARDLGAFGLLRSIADREGVSSDMYVQVSDRAWLADRRAIRAFFIQNVDRDKLVLFGEADGLGGEEVVPEQPQDGEMSRRSREYMDRAEELLRLVRLAVNEEMAESAIGLAYEAMLNAAWAALSERDLHSRTHRGTWHLFHTEFVAGGRFDPELHALASGQGQEMRHDFVYVTASFPEQEARELAEGAQRFVAAVEAMLSAERDD